MKFIFKLFAGGVLWKNFLCLSVFSLAFLTSFLFPFEILAQEKNQIIVNQIRFSADHNLILEVSAKSEFRIFTLENPSRLVVDLKDAKLSEGALNIALPFFISSVRNSVKKDEQQNSILRIVFDLKQKVAINKTIFQKIKNNQFGQIVVDLTGIDKSYDGQTSKFVLQKAPEIQLNSGAKNKDRAVKIIQKIPIIVIDAGHGGKDPGTIGDYARTKEKNITLAYAKELKKSLDNTKNYKVFLTRDDDFFIPLRQRVEKARKLKADLFISLHANSIAEPATSGFSIYTLSKKSSDKQAEMLAQKENRADIIAGVNFSGASPDIMKTLIDLSQRDIMNSSSRFANMVIRVVNKSEIKILQNSHRFAGFAVLTAPDMSSVLIELGYLSNKQEEKQLNNLIYKRKLVASLNDAIDEYFHKNLIPSKTSSKHE